MKIFPGLKKNMSRILSRFVEPQKVYISFPGGSSNAGKWVSEDSALTVSAVFACVRNLAEDIAGMPLNLYYRDAEGRKKADWRREYDLLHTSPNPYQTAFDFKESLIASLLLWGNGYAEKEKALDGSLYALHFISPEKVRIRFDGTQIIYIIDGKELTRKEIFHVHAFSLDGISGRSIIRLARDTIGLSLATEEFGSSFFSNGAMPGGVLEWENHFKDDASIKRFMEFWNQAHQGSSRANKTAVLENGMKYKSIGIPPEDSQFLETRKFQVAEVARWFRMPPHKIGDLERATFSNIEHQSIEYVTNTLLPWLKRLEQAYQVQLLSWFDRKNYYFEHLVDGLLRGDIKSRYDAYSVGRQWGWLSANDIRRLENMDPIAGGDEYLRPLNMDTAGTKKKQEPQNAEGLISLNREAVHDPQ